MTTLTLTLDSAAYQRLAEASQRAGKPPHALAEEWVVERLDEPARLVEEDAGAQALRAAGILTDLSPELLALADPTVRLEEVLAAMANAEGPTLGEIVLEQRRAKEW